MAQKFIVREDFTLLKARTGAVLDDGAEDKKSLPVLGQYHKGHVYKLTEINRSGVYAAVEKKLAALGV